MNDSLIPPDLSSAVDYEKIWEWVPTHNNSYRLSVSPEVSLDFWEDKKLWEIYCVDDTVHWIYFEDQVRRSTDELGEDLGFGTGSEELVVKHFLENNAQFMVEVEYGEVHDRKTNQRLNHSYIDLFMAWNALRETLKSRKGLDETLPISSNIPRSLFKSRI